jgi:putative ABC transport system permease protein
MSLGDWLPWLRDRRTDELSDEMRAHLEMAAADRIARGESPADAAASARREFGNAGLAQEIARDQWGGVGMWIEHLVQDVRFAVRMLRRSPGFTIVAVLTMALAIGTTTAMFSVVDATLLRPQPYPQPGQLVRIEDDLAGIGARDVGMSTPEWWDLERSGVFQYVSPTWYDNNNLTGLDHAQRVSLLIVAPNYFTMLGVGPARGSAFDPADRTPGFNGQVMISDGLWKRVFGGDPRVIGRVVQLDSDSYRVIGVMPPGFHSPEHDREGRGTEVWVAFGFAGAPLTTPPTRTPLFPGAIARLAPGTSVEDAQRRVDALVRDMRRQYPADYPPSSDWRVRLVPLDRWVNGDVRQPLLFLFGAVAFVLLIACANVANLLLARATARAREMALRQALGGGPARLIRQLLTESVVLSMLGALLGLALLVPAQRTLAGLIPEAVPRLNEISIDRVALCFALGASLLAGIVFGLVPALQVRRMNLTGALKQEGRGATSSGSQARARRAFVVAQFALSLTLMISAALLVRSFWRLEREPLGFDPQRVMVVRTRLPYPNDPKEDLYPTAAAQAPFVREVIRRALNLGGVQEVAVGSGGAVPLDHPYQDQPVRRVVLEDRPATTTQPVYLTASEVTPEYFGLLGMRLVRGRLLDDHDDDQAPWVAIINQAMARTYWPDQDALGKRLKLSPSSPAWTTVVGIIGDARTDSLARPDIPQVYASLYQQRGKHLAIFLRGQFELAVVERAMRDQVQSINAALPVFAAERLDETVSASLAARRFAMELIAAFAVTALVLSALGIYGVVSYMVGERTTEIGVRLALGARPADVMRMVVRQGAQLALMGGVVGLAGALVVSRLLAGVLYGVTPMDPLAFTLTTALLTAVALVACYIPARRAMRVDLITALHG